MATAGFDHGYDNHSCGNLTAGSITGGIGVGRIVATAAGTTTITDANVKSSSEVIFSALGSGAGLLLRTKTCYIGTVSNGSFTFIVSATGAGAPAGTETFSYFFLSES